VAEEVEAEAVAVDAVVGKSHTLSLVEAVEGVTRYYQGMHPQESPEGPLVVILSRPSNARAFDIQDTGCLILHIGNKRA
jgi:hypothetical protein